METAQLFFHARRGHDRDAVVDGIQGYLAELGRSGRVRDSESKIVIARGGYRVFVSVPEAAALERRFDDRSTRGQLRALVKLGVEPPDVLHFGIDPTGDQRCGCRKRPFLILFTNFLDRESPVRCGACFGPIPLYRLPAINRLGTHQGYLFWQAGYQAFDTLWMQSGAGERFAQRQLERHDSPLSQQGRTLARALERKARRPVYYCLERYHGRSERAERARRCPSCDGEWLRAEPLHLIFDFECRHCRLLSNIAYELRG